ncbi:helix-turn-helix transcriptional regulator [Paenibacillus sp. P96]|uniref:Helix-turn-helix transcriptional regulator n=1 Tax=Paenibacillus zeirhizosphaerae TaxID=2987519 RepID=A0ABT9FNR3_9BACL|nr:helix-turn-helix transcriptional regulator [Paenibacillus sp. P96]MDP4096364.1 helix-turn-helix transcriptional regulator [Paenibacillus sp. P96]
MKTRRSSTPLGEFIKSRRERLQPAEAGIDPLPGRRRTPGLRREEVAYLANMSVTYYTWLEQGREVNPSPEILLNISQALLLNEDEQKHLFDLANIGPGSTGTVLSSRPDTVFLQNIVDQLHYPSFVTDEGTDVIAWNRAAELIITDFGSLPENERYMMNVIFLDPDYRKKLENWEDFARYSAAILRANFDIYKNNPLYMERFERLRRESEEFVHLWELYEIKQKRVATAQFLLPDRQKMEFMIHYASAIDNDPGLHWCFFVPMPGSGTEEKLLHLLEQDTLLQ